MTHRKEFILDDNPLDRVMFSDGTKQGRLTGMERALHIEKALAAHGIQATVTYTLEPNVNHRTNDYLFRVTVEGLDPSRFVFPADGSPISFSGHPFKLGFVALSELSALEAEAKFLRDVVANTLSRLGIG